MCYLDGDNLPTEAFFRTMRQAVQAAVHIGIGVAHGMAHGVDDRRGLLRAGAAVEEHEAIYRAIRDGHPDEAAEATAVHLDRTLEDYRREIQRRLFG